jgi:WD40 repeat protein
LYELLTLRPTFDAATRLRLIERVVNDVPTPPRKRDPSIPRDLETIVLKAIAKEPGERYATAKALADDLENYLLSKPITARRVGVVERAWRWCRRNPAAAGLVGASAIAILTLVGLGVAVAYQSRLQAAYAAKDAALSREQTFLYENRVLFAQREIEEDNLDMAEALLDECPPDRRQWEWHYLKRLCHPELQTLSGHVGTVYSLAVSPDGRWIASGGADRTVRVWEAATGKLFRTLRGHGQAVFGVGFSPDSQRIASVAGTIDESDRLLVHEVETGQMVLDLPLDTGYMCTVNYRPDGRAISVASGHRSSQGWIRLLDADTGSEIDTIPVDDRAVYAASFSPDGTSLVTVIGLTNYDVAKSEPNRVVVWDLASHRERYRLHGHTAGVFCAGFSLDGRTIATGGIDSTVRLYDAADGSLLRTCPGHRSCVNAVAFSHDGRRVASASDDRTTKVWDVGNGRELLQLREYSGKVYGVSFAPDGRRIVTSDTNGTVKLFDATTDRNATVVAELSGQGRGVNFSPDGRWLAACGMDSTVTLIDVAARQSRTVWADYAQPVYGVTFSPDGELLASAGGDWTRSDILGEILIREVPSGRVVHRLAGHKGIARVVAFSPDGRLLASCGGEWRTPGQEVILWDVATERPFKRFPEFPGGVSGIAFTPDGRRLIASQGSTIHSFDVEGKDAALPFESRGDVSYSSALSPDGRWVVTSGEDGRVMMWDSATGRRVRTLRGGLNIATALAFSGDGRRLVAAASDAKAVCIWDFVSGQCLVTLRFTVGGDGVAFSPDGRLLATCHADGRVLLWDGSPWVEPAAPKAETKDGTDESHRR